MELEWAPLPMNIRKGSRSKGCALPAIAPPRGLKDFQVGWFWNLFWASAEAGGYLPTGPELWQLTGAFTRARWDANRAAVLAAFECTLPDADGRFQIFYPPLVRILEQQKRKLEALDARYKKSSRAEISSVSTGFHTGGGVSSPSLSQSGFNFDSKNQDQNQQTSTARANPGYTQADFDSRDLRKMKGAQDKFDRKCQPGVHLPEWMRDEKKVFEWVCWEAGITVARGLELEVIQKKWPESVGAPDMSIHAPVPALNKAQQQLDRINRARERAIENIKARSRSQAVAGD